MRWWEMFPAGEVPLDGVVEIARHEAEGAVLVCAGVDKQWYRREVSLTPGDNRNASWADALWPTTPRPKPW